MQEEHLLSEVGLLSRVEDIMRRHGLRHLDQHLHRYLSLALRAHLTPLLLRLATMSKQRADVSRQV